MLFLAAPIRIPEELMEAARVDGAGPWKIFWRIQFPLILPTVGIGAFALAEYKFRLNSLTGLYLAFGIMVRNAAPDAREGIAIAGLWPRSGKFLS